MGEKLKTKPKFRVGQVVMVRDDEGEWDRPIKLFQRTKWGIRDTWGNTYDPAKMRPLTARERGPRRPAARGK